MHRIGFANTRSAASDRLYYYRARYYDPRLGRFLSEDPIGFWGGVNFYAVGRQWESAGRWGGESRPAEAAKSP